MFKQATFLGCLIGFSLMSTCSFAGVYKWTATDGEIIYSQTPPPSGTDFEYVEDPAASTNSTSSQQNLEKIQKQLDEAKAERDKNTAEQERIAESNQIKQENCQQAKLNLSNLTSRGQVTIKEGNLYRKLNEEERQAKIKETEAAIQEFCS